MNYQGAKPLKYLRIISHRCTDFWQSFLICEYLWQKNETELRDSSEAKRRSKLNLKKLKNNINKY
jgi:hypothetical protein